jgi:hypothetical protein
MVKGLEKIMHIAYLPALRAPRNVQIDLQISIKLGRKQEISVHKGSRERVSSVELWRSV